MKGTFQGVSCHSHNYAPPGLLQSLTQPHYLAHSVDADVPRIVVHEARRSVGHGVEHLFRKIFIDWSTVELTGVH